MQVKGKPRFFLFVAYGSQQFGLDFGHRKIFFLFFFVLEKGCLQANQTLGGNGSTERTQRRLFSD